MTASPFVDIAPQVADGLVYASTIGLPPNGHGALYALDAGTGAMRWRLSTIQKPWRFPSEAGGGGAWYTPSVDGGEVYWGIANPTPSGARASTRTAAPTPGARSTRTRCS